MRFSLRSLLTLTLAVALMCGWWLDRRQLEERFHRLGTRLVMAEVALAKERSLRAKDEAAYSKEKARALHALDSAAKSGTAVVFLDVDWSIDSKVGALQYRKFAEQYHLFGQHREVRFHYANVTSLNQSSLSLYQLPGWQPPEGEAKRAFVTGGQIVWLKAGRVLKVEHATAFRSTDELKVATERIFASADGSVRS